MAASRTSISGSSINRYLEMRSQGLYGTNALEAQLDLVYAFCQRELEFRHPGARHVTLYRGVNRMADHEVLAKGEGGHYTILLNNLNSFTCSRERACEFGDYILAVDIPLTKIFFHCGLLPGVLQGEDEFLVIGGGSMSHCRQFENQAFFTVDRSNQRMPPKSSARRS